MATRFKAVTAAEFLESLEADPAYVQRRAEQDKELAKSTQFHREKEAPLVLDLARVGVKVDSVWDLVNGVRSYDVAIPVLLDHLLRPYPDAIRDGIARALGTNSAQEVAWQTLRDEYCRTPDKKADRFKQGLAAALSGASDDSVIQDLIELIKDERNGYTRVLLLLGLRRSKAPEAKQTIKELAKDPVFSKEINRGGDSETTRVSSSIFVLRLVQSNGHTTLDLGQYLTETILHRRPLLV
jgi:hypothetical protein